MTIGFVAIARPTFDVGYASELAATALAALSSFDKDVVGTADLAMSDADVSALSAVWRGVDIDALVVVQATFTDSRLVAAAASTTDVPIVLWGAPEPRTGHRLRRNSLCGINLAAFWLAGERRDYRYVYANPGDPDLSAMFDAALSRPLTTVAPATRQRDTQDPGGGTVGVLAGSRIGVIGEHPDGFDPCGFDAGRTLERTGVVVEQVALDELFAAAANISEVELDAVISELETRMDLGELTRTEIEPSVRLHVGLNAICTDKEWIAVATRCWPECFTEFGGAACTAQGLLTSFGIPAQCEADAYGALTSLLLQNAARSVAFTADLVDLDTETDTVVVWHCGLAPFDMAASDIRPRGSVHSNRRLPLVSEFALREGPVTIARLSQSRGMLRLTLGRGEMLDAPRPFDGTAGTLRFERPATDVLDTIMSEGLEHHYGIVYGDVTEELRAVAEEWSLEVVEL